MRLWLDAQLSPHLAPWLSERLGIEATSARRLGLLTASDREIFDAARAENVVVMTKDIDFVHLLRLHGPPPRILWVTAGNTSNEKLKERLIKTLPSIQALFDAGESLIELAGD